MLFEDRVSQKTTWRFQHSFLEQESHLGGSLGSFVPILRALKPNWKWAFSASGIASAIRVFAILRDGRGTQSKQGRTRRADAQPLAGAADLGRRSSTFVVSLATGGLLV